MNPNLDIRPCTLKHQNKRNTKLLAYRLQAGLMLCAFAGIYLGGATSCTFMALQKNVEIYEQQVRLSGQLRNPSQQKKPVIVVLYQVLNDTKKVLSYRIYHKPDRFQFMVLPGNYLLFAFEDANQDLSFQNFEWAAQYGQPSAITVKPSVDQLHRDLTLQPPALSLLAEFPKFSSSGANVEFQLPKTRFGEIVTLRDRRFTEEMGRLGLWEPVRFLEEVGGGLFFLEHFDSEKIPVIFVHGAGGNPESWIPIIQQMDRTVFQPWLFFYPSGLYLDDATELFRQAISQMAHTHTFRKLIIVAHSMGGMIARAAINLAVQKGRWDDLSLLFVTISTPWGGIQGAQAALDYSTIGIIPSWVDLAPGSPFQKKLFETYLPRNIHFYLFFSFQGGRTPLINENNDGTVPLASQLTVKAQHSAKKILGFNEDHTSILESQDMIQELNELLKTVKK